MAAKTLAVAAVLAVAGAQNSTCSPTKTIAGFTGTYINGTGFSYSSYIGSVLLVTNVASF